MPKPSSSEENGSKSNKLTSVQSFSIEQVHRSELKNAPYNPRHITHKAKLKLRETLKAVGLVQPIVWNKRTGNIVGGHQRINQIDAIEGTRDYCLTVAVLDVDEPREKELNILLNNTENVGGEWELDKLKAILGDTEVKLLNTGFDHGEFMKMFGEAPSQPKEEHQTDLSDQLKSVKDAYDKLTDRNRTKDDQDFYNVIVWGSYNERKEFLDEFGLDDNRYIDGRLLAELVRDLKKAKLADAEDGLAGPGIQ